MSPENDPLMVFDRRIANRLPPFRAKVELSSEALRFTNRGSSSAFALVAGGIGCAVAAVLSILTNTGPNPPSLVMVWAPLFGTSILLIIAGLVESRKNEVCEIRLADWKATLTSRRRFYTHQWEADCSSLQLQLHQVELRKPTTIPMVWQGFGLCLWKGEELVTVFALSKDREFCTAIIEQSSGVLDALYLGEGKPIRANYT
jgi:hypothetical protein